METETTERRMSLLDRCIAEFDHALRVIASQPAAATPAPASREHAADDLEADEQIRSARLMRVNHSGEIAAQALYRGQAFVASDPEQRERLLQAAAEEHDHLAWCQERAEQLGAGPSLLSPGWYLGSLAIGMLAGLAGDRNSLGFLAETERQVAEHLERHLELLPENDTRSRAILEQMRADEVRHGNTAVKHGASELPPAVKQLMRAASRVMTTVAYRI
jgi:ubiquinone biosynthesis monooxygenase Coq7